MLKQPTFQRHHDKPTWTQIPCSSSGDKYFHTSTLYKDFLITYGGRGDDESTRCNEIKVLNLKTSKWQPFVSKGPERLTRSRHSACLFDNNKILIFGGYHHRILGQTSLLTLEENDQVLTINYEDIETTGGNDLKTCSHSADVYENEMFVFGGRSQEDPWRDNNDLWALNLRDFTWRLCETTGDIPESRTTHCSAVYKDKLYIFGGYSESKRYKISSICVLSFESMRWETVKPTGIEFVGRYGATANLFKDQLYIFGGFYGSKDFENDFLTYDFNTNKLERFEAEGDHSKIRFATSVIYKNLFIVWGGKTYEDTATDQIYQIKLNPSHYGNIYQGYADSFSSCFRSLLFSQEFSDITFSIENEQIPAHKIVLATRCKHFNNIFTSGMKESHSKIIEVTDTSIETFKVLLGFLYENEVELTESRALDLYQLADKYMQNDLLGLCEQYLCKNIRLDNFISMIEFVEKFDVEYVRDAILEFIIGNIATIKGNQAEYKVPEAYLWEVALRVSQKGMKK